MNQIDLVINKITVVLNQDENDWNNSKLIVLKPDATEYEVLDIIYYLYEEGFIPDRRIKYEIK